VIDGRPFIWDHVSRMLMSCEGLTLRAFVDDSIEGHWRPTQRPFVTWSPRSLTVACFRKWHDWLTPIPIAASDRRSDAFLAAGRASPLGGRCIRFDRRHVAASRAAIIRLGTIYSFVDEKRYARRDSARRMAAVSPGSSPRSERGKDMKGAAA
jgi:hypothetical protein